MWAYEEYVCRVAPALLLLGGLRCPGRSRYETDYDRWRRLQEQWFPVANFALLMLLGFAAGFWLGGDGRPSRIFFKGAVIGYAAFFIFFRMIGPAKAAYKNE
jgi:hypothetical protein